MTPKDLKLGSSALSYAETGLYMLVGLGLVVMAGLVLVQTGVDLFTLSIGHSLTLQIAMVLNDILFSIILLELLSTVITHLSEGGFQLKPFLIIGIISSVRRILVLGAQLSTSQVGQSLFKRELLELGLDGLVALILTVALVIVTKHNPEINKT